MSIDYPKQEIISEITNFYLSSREYNGIPVADMARKFGIIQVKRFITNLLNEGKVCVVYNDYHPNPHIKALDPEPVSEQIEKVNSEKFIHACVYPTADYLKGVVNQRDYEGRPFELRLALGAAQFSFISFDLSILERYRNDPRYHYQYNDILGSISVTGAYYESGAMRESDQILLEKFGISFDENENAYIAVFLRYLCKLSAEHQQFWASKRVDTETHLHPGYYSASIIGDWPDRISLYEAILMEMRTINDISEKIGRPAFFRHDYSGEKRPREFGYLLLPTCKEYNDFIHLLDKMISENINKDFFRSEVAEISHPAGKPKGSLQILEDWIKSQFSTNDWTDIEEMFKTFRRIRKLRQKPAHSICVNKFDQALFREQKKLMKNLYNAVKTLRLILHLHPMASSMKIDRHLEKGLIWAV